MGDLRKSFASQMTLGSRMSRTISRTLSRSGMSVGGNGDYDDFDDGATAKDSQDFTVIANHATQFGAGAEAEDFNFEITLHDTGYYPLALPKLVKLISSTPGAIHSCGGYPVTRRGITSVTVTRSNNRKKAANRYVDLSNGKVRIFKVADGIQGRHTYPNGYKDGQELSLDELTKEYTYALQRIYSVKYDSLDSKKFSLVFWKAKRGGRGLSYTARGMFLNRFRSPSQNTLSKNSPGSMSEVMDNDQKAIRARLDSNTKKGKGRLKGSMSFLKPRASKKAGKAAKTIREGSIEEASHEVNSRPPYSIPSSSRFRRTKTGGRNMPLPNNHFENEFDFSYTGDSRPRSNPGRRTGTLGTRLSGISQDTNHDTDFKGSYISNHTVQTQETTMKVVDAPKERNLLMRDRFGNVCDIEEDEVEFAFDNAALAQDWLRHILLEIENQARLFSSYVTMFDITKGGCQIENYEIMIRKSVDLFTLARGVRDREVWDARQKLAKFLESIGREEDSRLWFELSHPLRASANILDLIEQVDVVTSNSGTERISKAKNINNQASHRDRGTQFTGRSSYHSFQSFGSYFKFKNSDLKISPPKSKDEAFENLASFFEVYGRGEAMMNSNECAEKMISEHSYLKIARMLEAEYGRVPEGFEFYLIAAGKTPIESIQSHVEDLKEEVRVTKGSSGAYGAEENAQENSKLSNVVV